MEFSCGPFRNYLCTSCHRKCSLHSGIHECEVHRIAKDGATVHVVTPHFSYIDSYTDPTRRWHLSSEWYTTMTDYYLQVQVSRVTHLKGKIRFGKSTLSFIPQIIIILKGINWWKNRHLC